MDDFTNFGDDEMLGFNLFGGGFGEQSEERAEPSHLQPVEMDHPQTPQEHVPVNTKKQKWTAEEDQQLLESVRIHGTSNWPLIASALTGRTGKQCRERWLNQLKPDLIREDWTTQEDHILMQQQRIFGNSWSKIALSLPGRSANAIKNRWSWLNRHKNRNQRNLAAMPQPGLYSPGFYYPTMMVAPGTPNFNPYQPYYGRPGFDPRALSDPRYMSDPNVVNSLSQGGSADLSLPHTPQESLPTTPLIPQNPPPQPLQQAPPAPPTTEPSDTIFGDINQDFDNDELPFW